MDAPKVQWKSSLFSSSSSSQLILWNYVHMEKSQKNTLWVPISFLVPFKKCLPIFCFKFRGHVPKRFIVESFDFPPDQMNSKTCLCVKVHWERLQADTVYNKNWILYQQWCHSDARVQDNSCSLLLALYSLRTWNICIYFFNKTSKNAACLYIHIFYLTN